MIWIRIYGRSFLAIGPSGLVTILLDQPCQFRGGWSKRIVVAFSSESDSNTFTNEETQYHISYYSFSLTMAWIASLITHEYPWRNNLQSILVVWDVCSLFSASGCLLIPLRLQEMATLKKGDQLKMWEFIRIWELRSVQRKANFFILWLTDIFFLICEDDLIARVALTTMTL